MATGLGPQDSFLPREVSPCSSQAFIGFDEPHPRQGTQSSSLSVGIASKKHLHGNSRDDV